MKLKSFVSQLEDWKEWRDFYNEYVPKFIEEARKGENYGKWVAGNFIEFFEKSRNHCVSSLQQGYFNNDEKEKIKLNWDKLAPLFKELAESQNSMNLAVCKQVVKEIRKCTTQNKSASTHRLIASLQPQLLCTIVNEKKLNQLIDIMNSKFDNCRISKTDNWFVKSNKVLNYYVSELEQDPMQIMTLPWQTYDHFTNKSKSLKKSNFMDDDPIQTTNNPSMHNLNTILYGPPGTGKTYSTMNKSLEILGANTDGMARDKLMEHYNEFVLKSQIVFTTFHQSMAYEDFIEGIKPITVNSEIKYEIQDGIFKKVCESAMDSIKEYIADKKTNVLIPSTLTFEQKYKLFVQAIQQDRIKVKTRTGIEAEVSHVSGNGNMRLTTGASNLGYIISSNRLRKLVENYPDPTIIQNVHDEIRSVIGGSHASLYYAALTAFTEFDATLTSEIREEGTDLSFADIRLSKEEIKDIPKYVLIIDEINRGNVSAIFGELITLIEEDKRLFAENALSLDLAYSKGNPEKFTVPPNLYIIGTMNTADRSVEALDTALRRRFSFTEMLATPELLSPSAMLTRLFWKYENVDWKDAEYKPKEEQLRTFFGLPDDKNWERRKDFWATKMKGNDPCILTHLDYLNSLATLNLQTLLETMNKRIELLVDRDHTIGHAFFMNVDSLESLQNTFAKNVIPLLQEYFYGDYSKMEMVIGPLFFNQEDRKVEWKIFAITNNNYDLPENQIKLLDVAKMENDTFIHAIKRMMDVNYKEPKENTDNQKEPVIQGAETVENQ